MKNIKSYLLPLFHCIQTGEINWKTIFFFICTMIAIFIFIPSYAFAATSIKYGWIALDSNKTPILAGSQYHLSSGKATPIAYISNGGGTIKAVNDKAVVYLGNTKFGTAQALILGDKIVGYKDAFITTFKIVDYTPIKDAKIEIEAQTYTGKALTPAAKVTLSGKTLKSGSDYDIKYEHNTNVGKANVTIIGKGIFSGTAKATFNIDKSNIAKAKMSNMNNAAYTGKEIKPKPTVTLSGKQLKLGQDYDLSYKNNINSGTATVTVIGKGNYKGSLSGKFTIESIYAKVNTKKYYYTWHKDVSSASRSKIKKTALYVPKNHVLSTTHVEPLWYVAKVKKDYTGTTNKGNKVKLKKGSIVLAIYRNGNGESNIVVQDKAHRGEVLSKVPSKYISSLATLTNNHIIYTAATAEAFVNKKDIKSPTNKMLWFNRGTQRLYLFTGKKGHWKVVKNCWNKESGKRPLGCKANSESYAHYNTSSGAGNGIKNHFNHYALFNKDTSNFQGISRYLHYQSPGGSGIHAGGGTGKPSTHGCIAVTSGNLDVVWKQPTKSRVAVY